MLTEKRWKILFWTCFCLTFGRSLSASVPFTNLDEEQSSEISDIKHLTLVKTDSYPYSSDRVIREENLNSDVNVYSYKPIEDGITPKEVSNEKTRFVPKTFNAGDNLNRKLYNNRIQNTAQGLEIPVRKTREANHAARTLDHEPYFQEDHGSDIVPNKVKKYSLIRDDETKSRIKDFDDFPETKVNKKKEKSVSQAVAFIVTPESFASLLKGGINKNAFDLRDGKKVIAEKLSKNKGDFFTRDSSLGFKNRRKNSEEETRQWDYISSDANSRNNEDNRYMDDFESYDKVEKFERREPFSTKLAPLVNEEKTDRLKKQFSSSFDDILLSAKLKIDKGNGKARPSMHSKVEKVYRLKNEEEIDTFIESFDPNLSSTKFLSGKKSMSENNPNRKSSERNHSKSKLKKDGLDEYILEDKTGNKYKTSLGKVDSFESSKRFEKINKGNFDSKSLKDNRISPLKLTRRGDSDELSDLLNLLDLSANLKSEKINKSSSKNHGNQKIKNISNEVNKKSDDRRKEINYFSEEEENSKENYFKDLSNKYILRDESQAKQDSNKDGCDITNGQLLADDRDVKRVRCKNLKKNDSSKNKETNSSYPEKYKSIVEKLNKNPNLISKFDFQLLNGSSLLKSDDKTDFPANRNNGTKPNSKLFENLLQLHELTQGNKKISTKTAHSSKEILSKEKNSSIALRENKEKSNARSKDRSNKSVLTLAELINSYHEKGVEKDGGVTDKIPSRSDLGNTTGFASSTLRPKSFQDVTEGIKNISKYFSITPTKLPNFSKIESSNNITQFFSLPAGKSISSDSMQVVPLSISSLTPGGSPVFINSHVFVSSTPFPELLSQLDYVPRIRTPSSLSPNEISNSPGVHYHILPGLLKGNHALRGLLEGDPISSSILSGLNTVSNKGLIGISDPLQRLNKNNKLNSADVTTPSTFAPRTSSAFSNSSPFPTTPFPTTPFSNTPYPTSPFPTTSYPTTPISFATTPTAPFPTTPYPTLHPSTLRPNLPIFTLSDNLHSSSPFVSHQPTTPFAASQHPSSPFPNFPRSTTPILGTISHVTSPFAPSQHQSSPFPNFSRSTTPNNGAISHVTSPFPTSQHFPVTSFPSSLHPSNSLYSNAPHPVTTLTPFTPISNSQSYLPHSAAPLTEFINDSPFSHQQNSLGEVTKNLAPLNLNPKIQLSVSPITKAFNHSPSPIRPKPTFSTPSFTTNLPKQLSSTPLSPSIQKPRQTTSSRRLRARIKARERTPTLSPLIDSNIQTQVSIGPSIPTRPGNLIKVRKKVRRKGRRPLLKSQNSPEIASQVSHAISPIPKIVNALQDTFVSTRVPANTISNSANFHNQNLEAELTTLNGLNKVVSSDLNSNQLKDFPSFADAQEIRKRRPINKSRGKGTNHASTTAVPTINLSSTTKSFQSNLKQSLVHTTDEQISSLPIPISQKKTKLPQKTVPTIKNISAVPRVQNPTLPASHQVLSNFPLGRSLKPLHSVNSITPVSKGKSQSIESLQPFVRPFSSQHFPSNFDLNRQVNLQANNEYPSNIRFISENGIGNPALNGRFHHQFPGLSPNFAVSDGLEIIPRNSFERSFLLNSIPGVNNGEIGIPYLENALPDLPRHQARTFTPSIGQGSYFTPNAGFDQISERYPVNFHSGPNIIPVGRSVGFDSSLMTRVPPTLRKYYLQDV